MFLPADLRNRFVSEPAASDTKISGTALFLASADFESFGFSALRAVAASVIHRFLDYCVCVHVP